MTFRRPCIDDYGMGADTLQNANYNDPAHWHERAIICHSCESGFSIDMTNDTPGQQNRGKEGAWVTTQYPACLNPVPLHKLSD